MEKMHENTYARILDFITEATVFIEITGRYSSLVYQRWHDEEDEGHTWRRVGFHSIDNPLMVPFDEDTGDLNWEDLFVDELEVESVVPGEDGYDITLYRWQPSNEF